MTTANHLRVPEAARDQGAKFVHTAIGVTNYEPLLFLADELGGIMPCTAKVILIARSHSGAVDSDIKRAT